MSSRRDCSVRIVSLTHTRSDGVLTDTEMRVDTRVPRSSSQVLVLAVRDVEVRLGVTVLLGESKVDDIDLVAPLADTHEEVVGLDVAVDEVARVDVLDSRDLHPRTAVSAHVSTSRMHTYELVGEEENSLEGELAVAEVEEILETGSEEVDDHGVVVALDSEPSHERNSDSTGERLVHLGLILELRVLGLDGLELDGDLFARDDVDTQVDVT